MNESRKIAREIYSTSSGEGLGARPVISDNLMKVLVNEEVNRQCKLLPATVARFINKGDVVVYALNRLPGIYATTRRGREIQERDARVVLKSQIENAVRQGLAAVQQDPLRSAEPWKDPEISAMDAVLDDLRQILKYDQLTVDNLSELVKYRLAQVARGDLSWKQEGSFDWEKFPLHQRSVRD